MFSIVIQNYLSCHFYFYNKDIYTSLWSEIFRESVRNLIAGVVGRYSDYGVVVMEWSFKHPFNAYPIFSPPILPRFCYPLLYLGVIYIGWLTCIQPVYLWHVVGNIRVTVRICKFHASCTIERRQLNFLHHSVTTLLYLAEYSTDSGWALDLHCQPTCYLQTRQPCRMLVLPLWVLWSNWVLWNMWSQNACATLNMEAKAMQGWD